MQNATKAPSARKLIATLAPQNPGKRWATNAGTSSYHAESSVAVWHENQWVLVFGRLLGTEEWCRVPNLLVNGVPVVNDWIEVLP